MAAQGGLIMADDRIEAYAEAMFSVARAEGNLAEVEDELFRFARALEGSEDLRTALTDTHIPASRRQQVIEELLGSQATPTTISLLAMAVGIGRAKDLPAIIDRLVRLSAQANNRLVAEVRSVIELDESQRARLAAAIEKATGHPVEIRVIIDPSILGGLVTEVGDTVIDGSVRSRLDQLRKAV
jgi:F-type H+-transporting ATPase subunit delta